MDINIIVNNPNIKPTDQETLFGDEEVMLVDEGTVMQDLVVDLGLFSSKSQAMKAGRKGALPTGWNRIKGNKKTFLFIWNPTE